MPNSSFKSVEELNLDASIIEENITINPNTKKKYENHNSDWIFSFERSLNNIIYKYFRIDQDYKKSLKYQRELIKVLDYIKHGIYPFFQDRKRISLEEEINKTIFTAQQQKNFSEEMIDWKVFENAIAMFYAFFQLSQSPFQLVVSNKGMMLLLYMS